MTSKLFTRKVVKLSDAIESSIHADTRKIILNFKDIEILDNVSVVYHNCETLYLSQNRIKNLHGLFQFKNLRNLSLSYNLVCVYFGYLGQIVY
jgi:Leucine-rich repeat (LRR) protein